MKYEINDGVLKDIIWENGDGTTLTIPDGVEVIDTQFRITGRVDTVFLPDSIIEIKAYAFMDSSGNDIEIQNIYYNGTLSEWCAVTKGFHEIGVCMYLWECTDTDFMSGTILGNIRL